MHRLLRLLLLCLDLLAATTTHAQYEIFSQCETNTNYTLGSAFQANLEAALSSLPSAAAASWGFAKNVTGAAPDEAFALAQCRRDVSAPDCRQCVADLAQKLFSDCQGQKSAIIVSAVCLVRHSNASFFGVSDSTLVISYNSAANATQLEVFSVRVQALMKALVGKAAFQSPRLYAVGSAEDLTPKVYGVAQCTGDLTDYGCYSCLDRAVVAIRALWQNKDGCQIIFRSCFIRFESSLFYDSVAAEAAMASSSPALASSNSGQSAIAIPLSRMFSNSQYHTWNYLYLLHRLPRQDANHDAILSSPPLPRPPGSPRTASTTPGHALSASRCAACRETLSKHPPAALHSVPVRNAERHHSADSNIKRWSSFNFSTQCQPSNLPASIHKKHRSFQYPGPVCHVPSVRFYELDHNCNSATSAANI